MTDDNKRIAALEAQIKSMAETLLSLGVRTDAQRQEQKQHDYIGHGSKEHAAFLGLVKVDGKDAGGDTITYTGKTGTYTLEDNVTQFMSFANPRQVAELVLRQKVNELEAGAPKAFAGAPEMWNPTPQSVSYGGY